MIADVNVRLALTKIFPSIKFISNEIEFAEYPGPELQKIISDPSVTLPDKEWNNNSGQEDDHEHSEDNDHPECVEFVKNCFQKFSLKLRKM